MSMRRTVAVCVLALVGATACDRPPPAPPALPPAAATQPTASEIESMRQFVQPSGPVQSELPPGHPPLDVGGGAARPPAEPRIPVSQPDGRVVALRYDPPVSWKKEAVTLPMRIDQYRLPGEGDNKDGELVVFGQIGGGVEGNVQRWRSQFSTPDGKPVPDSAFHRESLEAAGLTVTLVDITGRYAGAAMGAAGTTPLTPEDYRMLGAIIETPSGPYYFKAVGPAATMARHHEDFVAFVKTVRIE